MLQKERNTYKTPKTLSFEVWESMYKPEEGPWLVSQLGGMPSCAPKGCGFDPWLGHMWETPYWCFSLTLMHFSL